MKKAYFRNELFFYKTEFKTIEIYIREERGFSRLLFGKYKFKLISTFYVKQGLVLNSLEKALEKAYSEINGKEKIPFFQCSPEIENIFK